MGVIMRAIIFALGLALGLTAGSPLSRAAGAPNVQELLRRCAQGSEWELYCIGYVSGIGTLMLMNGSLTDFGICSAGTIPCGAMEQAFRNWAEKHPEKWGAEAHMGVMLALRETWPCK